MHIDVVNVEDPLEALALRSALEWWGIRVNLHLIGAADRLVALLDGSTLLTDTVILMCHGIEEGLFLPELAPEFEAQQRYHKALSPTDLREFLRLPDKLVINTGYGLGTSEYASAFLDAGCRAYIGADDYPDGSASLFFMLHFFYAYYHQKVDLKQAHTLASSHDVDTQMFKLYMRDG